MSLWKINCVEKAYPGMWQRWFRHQCVGIGWCSELGYPLKGKTKSMGWKRARKALLRIEVDDHIVVALSGHRVGRLGQVTGKAIDDSEWDPLVPVSTDLPHGEMGRRIFVRWDLLAGPDDRETVVLLPPSVRFSQGELRPALAEIQSVSLEELRTAMADASNWVSLFSHFKHERALSDYIATFPHRLEDGLLRYPNDKVREKVFADQSRSDVLLVDRMGNPVIVECKQGQPTITDLDQLRHYMGRLEAETGITPRGILVHGGSRKLRQEILDAARKTPVIEIVQYRLEVDFAKCG